MSHLAEWWRRLAMLLQRDRATADLEEEMRLHRDLRAAGMMERGASNPDAVVAARRSFGRADGHLEQSRDAWGLVGLDTLRHDLRFAFRRLRQRPGFTAAVIIILALGTGATTAMFSAVDAAILRPLPFPRADKLVILTAIAVPNGAPGSARAHPVTIVDVMAMKQSFAHVAGYTSGGLNLDDAAHPVRLRVGIVTPDFFATMGVAAERGRWFVAEDAVAGATRVAMISHDMWQRTYGGREIVGQYISMNHQRYAVVGVMAPGFRFPDQSDVWIPMSIPISAATFEAVHVSLHETIVARVADSVSIDGAATRLRLRWDQAGLPKTSYTLGEVRRAGPLVPLQLTLGADRVRTIKLLFGMTVLLLVIACANVINLMLGQSIARGREIAVRQMLGARRSRLVRQLLTESMVLSIAGGLCGVALAPIALAVVRQALPAALLSVSPVRVDVRVLAFAVSVAIIVGVVAGVWPAFRAANSGGGLNGAGTRSATARRGGLIRRLLVTLEIGLTTVLLVGAGLLLHSFRNVIGIDRGINVEHVVTAKLAYPRWEGHAAERIQDMTAIVSRLRATAGVTAVGFSNDLAFDDAGILMNFSIVDSAPGTRQPAGGMHWMMVSPGYFAALGVPVVKGRPFGDGDDSLTPVAIVDAATAHQYFPHGDAIGHLISLGGNDPPATVVGIAADVIDEAPGRVDRIAQIYFPIANTPPPSFSILVRGTSTNAAIETAIVHAVHDVDQAHPVYDIRPLRDVMRASDAPRRTSMQLMSLFAALALVLAGGGIYAVIAEGVASRRREFGIRAALGATASAVVNLVCREGLVMLGGGLLAGLVAAWLLSRLIASMVFGIATHDPLTFIAVPLVIALPALIATLIPALRASRTNPAEVMRAE